MTKPFLFINTKVTVNDGSVVESWELITLGDSQLMHAAWNPERGVLVCQFNSVKETLMPYPVPSKNGKTVQYQDRKMESYYRIAIEDKAAVKYILDNLTVNFAGQTWDIIHESKMKQPVEEESTI